MITKQLSLQNWRLFTDSVRYALQGGMRIKQGHLPSNHHQVPTDFMGVCVATNPNPAVDAYVIKHLRQLGVQRVRLDFTYGDLDNHNHRFLTQLIADGFNVTLHLIQPYESAQEMHLSHAQSQWRLFLQAVLTAFGSQIKEIEVGNTINRKKWSGYNMLGFLQAWNIAHEEIRNRGITLIGPNIQDFEPIYNIHLLKTLKRLKQLPDIASNNLFVERVIEPERYDFRVFKYRWTRYFEYNLIKKARLLQKVSEHFGVKDLVSPVAFWAIYRIQRILPNGLQKQADYAARYFLLLAASGAIKQANWGAFICQREGLITDGLTEAQYPKLERVSHYQQTDGTLADYRLQPSFYALKTVAQMIQGATYIQPIATSKGLEIHHFCQQGQHIHAAWTINGKAALLSEIYDDLTLKSAKISDRDGRPLLTNADLVTESPIYLTWQEAPKTIAYPQLLKELVIHRHIEGLSYFPIHEGAWRGMILAESQAQANQLWQSLYPANLKAPEKASSLRHARNAIWPIADPRDVSKQLTIKQPVKMYPHKQLFDRYKPSKAKRSWNGAMELMRRGIGTAMPVAYFEQLNDNTLKQNFYICEFVKSDANIGQIFTAFANGETNYLGVSDEQIYQQFAQFCYTMHGRLIYFRDFSGGNILVKFNPNQSLEFSLIDTARLKAYHAPPLPNQHRMADIVRACHKLHGAGRIRFLQIYLGLLGKQVTWLHHLQFKLYDLKVGTKRTVGRKGWKRLINRLKGKT